MRRSEVKKAADRLPSATTELMHKDTHNIEIVPDHWKTGGREPPHRAGLSDLGVKCCIERIVERRTGKAGDLNPCFPLP